MFGIPFPFLIAAVFLELSFLLLRRCANSGPVNLTIMLLLSAYPPWLLSVYAARRSAPNEQRRPSTRYLPIFIIGAAVAFRITLWPLDPPLTDDPWRYRWEARVQNSGGNPYASRPLDARWAPLRDATWPRVGQKDVPAGYGPAWEHLGALTQRLAEAITHDPSRQAFWFKLPAAAFEWATLGLIAVWLRRSGRPAAWLAIYAWSPLPLWEFWASGHNDAPVLFCMTLSLLLAESRRWGLSWAALGTAIALKFWPAILIPAWLFRNPRHRLTLNWWTLPYWKGPALALAVFAVCAIPYLGPDLTSNARYMTGFVGGWRNNDSLFGLILWIARDQYTAKYTAFALIAACAVFFATRNWPLRKSVLWTIVALLLLSSNCHPWYLTWLVPLLVFEPAAPLLLWIALMPLTYVVWIDWTLLGVWNGSSPLRWFVYLPVLIYLPHWVVNFRDVFRDEASPLEQ